MNEKLRAQVERLFADAPKTRRAAELQEELLCDLNDKFNDLVASGVPEDEAFKRTMNGVGDVDELIRGLKETNVMDYAEMNRQRKKTAAVVAASVGAILFSVILLILGVAAFHWNPVVMVVVMLAIILGASCMLIYHFMSRPRYVKADDTIVEEFKEWKSTSTRNVRVLKSIQSIVWSVTVALYFMIGFFVWGAWAYSWIIFLVAVAVNHIIKLFFELREDRHD